MRRVSGETLDVYCAEHIFGPLGMRDTGFKPAASLRRRIAPTQYEHGSSGPVLWGVVHDPTSRFMGGVAGHEEGGLHVVPGQQGKDPGHPHQGPV